MSNPLIYQMSTELLASILRRVDREAVLAIVINNEPREHLLAIQDGHLVLQHNEHEAELISAEIAFLLAVGGAITLRTILPHTPDDHENGNPTSELRGWVVGPPGWAQLTRDSLLNAATTCPHCDEPHELEPDTVYIGAEQDALVDDLTADIPTDQDDQDDDELDEAGAMGLAFQLLDTLEDVHDEIERLDVIIDDYFATIDYDESGDDPEDVYNSYRQVPEIILNQMRRAGNTHAELAIIMPGGKVRTHECQIVNNEWWFTYGAVEPNLIIAELMYCTIRSGVAYITTTLQDGSTQIRGWEFDDTSSMLRRCPARPVEC